MNKNTKLALAVIGVGAIAYYLYTKNKPAVTTKSFAGVMGNRLGFADGGYVTKGELYNNNMRYGLTGAKTFFTNESEKLNY
jgi:hypothetical protein